MGPRQEEISPNLRRERNRSLSRQRPEVVPAVIRNMGVGVLNNQRPKASSAVFPPSNGGASSNPRARRMWGAATFHASSIAFRVGSYLGPLLVSFFLISGLSYKTTFNNELRISSLPLYSI
jgi:hypothetical protein